MVSQNQPTLDMPVKQIAESHPAAKEVLMRRGLDLCCGGAHPLRMAAQAHGQDPEAVLAEILAAMRAA